MYPMRPGKLWSIALPAAIMLAGGCGDGDGDGHGDGREFASLEIPDLAAHAAKALPLYVPPTGGALTYSSSTGIEAENAMQAIGNLFGLECHDGQGNGFCPEGLETPETVFDSSILAYLDFVRQQLQDLYQLGENDQPPWESCAVTGDAEWGGEIGADGPNFEPAGSDGFILDSSGVLDCWGVWPEDPSRWLAYSKATDGRLAYLAGGAPQEARASVHQLYTRLAPAAEGEATEPEIIAMSQVVYNDNPPEPYGRRTVLILNSQTHAFAFKQRWFDGAVTAIGNAGIDTSTGVYHDGDYVVRLTDPDNNMVDPLTFCMENSADPTPVDAPGPEHGCNATPAHLFDSVDGAWSGADGVSAFLGLSADDEQALLGFGDVFDNGELFGPEDVPTSLTDGFPTGIAP
jgi:hypothetical protein